MSLEARAKNILRRNYPGYVEHVRSVKSDLPYWKWRTEVDAWPGDDRLLRWASTLSDEDILQMRNAGVRSLAWIREHQKPRPWWRRFR